jgi:hypothetical protein
MALKSKIWVKGHLRACFVAGLSGVVARRGAEEAGAVYVQVFVAPDRVILRAPAPGPAFHAQGHRSWSFPLGKAPVTPAEARAYLDRQIAFDPDIWIVDIDDPAGTGLL